ncbi:MAG: hypothetical protein HZA04_04730 [Nitrospinae bacterium]|nr:hypothetical protein [Nitrospinota bacterium]
MQFVMGLFYSPSFWENVFASVFVMTVVAIAETFSKRYLKKIIRPAGQKEKKRPPTMEVTEAVPPHRVFALHQASYSIL